MKVLFAINNDNDLNNIIKKYQKDYREILSYKNVYYFNAILKELQKDKTYDRVVISEDLEPFANNNYEIIDNFLIDKLSKVRNEAKKINGEKIDIILICTDRRNKADDIIGKYFKMGINNAILKQDRNIEEVCNLINKPKNENDARQYYRISAGNAMNSENSENYVSEAEVQNIIAHYKRLGKDEDRYVDSFNNIVTQYNDEQLRIIINYLPINVKAVLEEKSPKYQELITFAEKKPKYNKYETKEDGIGVKMLNNSSTKEKINRPIIIPSNINSVNIKKAEIKQQDEQPEVKKIEIPEVEIDKIENISDSQTIKKTPKRGRGRPKKIVDPQTIIEDKPKRGRGRPKKVAEEEIKEVKPINNKNEDEDDEFTDLFSLDDEKSNTNNETKVENDDVDLFSIDDNNKEKDEGIDLFSIDDDNQEKDEGTDLFSIDDDSENTEKEPHLFSMNDDENTNTGLFNTNNIEEQTTTLKETKTRFAHDISTLLTSDKKVVSFVGTTKNGTSFIVNNVAATLASMGISTAILDMTISKNAYYIYTNNEESLRNIAKDSINNLEKGIAKGIKVNKNLSVYTSLPGTDEKYEDFETIISTLVQNHSAVLIDTDFNTPNEIFEISQEIFLVQSLDVLTIQPLTAFLRGLKSKGSLKQEKLKIVINKDVKVRTLSAKTLIGGMAYYNDPAMSFMTELFNKDNILYCTIPFEIQNYSKYLEALVNCEINLNGYTKQFMYALNELTNMVYPLINKQKYKPMGNKPEHFSGQVNDTLNRMKNNY